MALGLADLTLEQLANLTLEQYATLKLQSDGETVTGCLWNQEQISLILSSLSTLASEMVNIKNDLTMLKATTAALAKPGDAMMLTTAATNTVKSGLATATDVSSAKTEIVAHGDQYWSGSVNPRNAPTAAENAAAVWKYVDGNGRMLSTPMPTVAQIQDGLASATEVRAARDTVIAHGNRCWTTASGFATVENLNDVKDELFEHGDANWQSADSPAALESIQESLDTIIAKLAQGSETVSDEALANAVQQICTHGDNRWVTATGFATSAEIVNAGFAKPADVNAARDQIIAAGNQYWTTATGFATAEYLSSDEYLNAAANILCNGVYVVRKTEH